MVAKDGEVDGRTCDANSYHIDSTLRTKATSKSYMTNENDICRQTSDSAKVSFYTNAWSSGNHRATETGYGAHGDTVTADFYSGFGAIDAKYKLEMGNPNNYRVRMVGDWTPNEQIVTGCQGYMTLGIR